MIARVALELALRKEFDYLIPHELVDRVDVGSRVKVPFGPREVMGCVTAMVQDSPHTNLRYISKVIGKQTLVTPKILKLARWIADYYCCPPEIALKSVLPEAVRKEKEGWKEQLFVRLIPRPTPVEGTTTTGPKLSKRQQEIWNLIQERKELPLQELLELAETTAETIRRLEDKGLISITTEISERDPYARETILATTPLPLNAEQQVAFEKIIRTMDAKQSAAGILPAEGVVTSLQQSVPLPAPDNPSPFFKKEVPIEKYSEWLPHWRQASKLYFVTFRLHDSVAQPVLQAWVDEKRTWEKFHPKPWNPKVQAEYNERFTKRMEEYLDAGYGTCVLADPRVREIVANALKHFDGERYQLGDFVIMPNHVHVLVRPAPDILLEDILHSWKSYTANQINTVLQLKGTLWREEYFDHLVRSERQYEKFQVYIRENPGKAHLAPEKFRVDCGSFRLGGTGIAPEVAKNCRQDAGSTFLLHGVTGSGKTEVYLQAIAHALKQGKGSIVLVPEISLTPQTVERFKARFSSGPLQTLVAVLHSHLSAGERHDEWHKIRQGRAKIVIGARSAIFAPVDPLGLIVVDEEHEHSYKQEEAPRYNARDVAVVRGNMEDAVVVLGSATPSIESFHNAQKGKYALLEMLRRADDKKMPHIKVVDMRNAAKQEKGTPIFSPQLKEALTQRLERKEQSILFLNRRGYATSLQCPTCGYVAECPNCSVSLTYHRAAQKICCHICGHQTEAPKVCPSCKNPAIRYAGLGTEKVESTLIKLFPKAIIRRMDSDTLKRKEDYRNILGDFKRGKIDILVGTQMIAKGLHFPNVTLVGIIYADLSLHIPDFRAAERTFQLLTQVAGRAGRGDVEGEVFVQAFTPFHPAIQYARRHDFIGFYEQELEFREQLKYPPSARVALLTLKGRNEEKVKLSADYLKRELEKSLTEIKDLILAGPAPAPLARAETFFRYQLMLRTKQMTQLSQIVAELKEKLSLPEEVTLTVDIDPVNLF